jgi:hypothetical protein
VDGGRLGGRRGFDRVLGRLDLHFGQFPVPRGSAVGHGRRAFGDLLARAVLGHGRCLGLSTGTRLAPQPVLDLLDRDCQSSGEFGDVSKRDDDSRPSSLDHSTTSRWEGALSARYSSTRRCEWTPWVPPRQCELICATQAHFARVVAAALALARHVGGVQDSWKCLRQMNFVNRRFGRKQVVRGRGTSVNSASQWVLRGNCNVHCRRRSIAAQNTSCNPPTEQSSEQTR